MFQLLLIIIYLAFISLGLPDSLLGSAWPTMYPVSYTHLDVYKRQVFTTPGPLTPTLMIASPSVTP